MFPGLTLEGCHGAWDVGGQATVPSAPIPPPRPPAGTSNH